MTPLDKPRRKLSALFLESGAAAVDYLKERGRLEHVNRGGDRRLDECLLRCGRLLRPGIALLVLITHGHGFSWSASLLKRLDVEIDPEVARLLDPEQETKVNA